MIFFVSENEKNTGVPVCSAEAKKSAADAVIVKSQTKLTDKNSKKDEINRQLVLKGGFISSDNS